MEELYQLISDRLHEQDDLIRKFNFLESLTSAQTPLTTIPHQMNEFSFFISKLRKRERVRILRENDYFEVIMSVRSFDLFQRA